MELSQIERFNATYKLSHALVEWEKSSAYPILSGIGARAVGSVVTPIAGIIDVIAHLVLAAIKFVTGIFITPYNFIAKSCCNKYMAPADLELSSACTHLFLSLKSLVFIPVVSLTAGFCPELASQNADSRIIFRSKSTLNLHFSF